MAEKILSPGVFQNESDQSLVSQGVVGNTTALVGPTAMGQPMVPTLVTSYTDYLAKFGSTFKSGSTYYEYFTSLAAKEFFNNGGQSLFVTRVISSSAYSTYATASIPWTANSASSSFVLETLAWGDQMNNTSSLSSGALDSGSAYNVRWEITNVNTSSGQFSLAIRAGNDNTAQPNYLEIWPNLSLDPGQANYISRVIGDLKPVFSTDSDGTPVVNITGSYTNASRYVRVASINPQVDSLDNNGVFRSSLTSSLPALGSGSYGGSFAGGLAATNLQGLYNENITANNIQGFPSASYITAFNLLSSKDDYKANVLLAPGIHLASNAATTAINTCQNRGDIIVPLDATLYGSVVSAAATTAANQSSNYAAAYYPWVQVYSDGLGKPVWVPPTTVVGGVYAFNDTVAAEWFAPAGLNRGGIPSVIRPERKLTQADRDNLYVNNINPLANFPGQGVVVFGQKTLQKKATALDRVNVRRLMIALKNYIGKVSTGLVFEQNTNVTRNRFLAQVNPYLESVVQKQGLYAYKVVMDSTNNTADVIDRNQLVGQIYIQPTKTAEFIILNFNLQPTGATFPA
jgi:hypothetical protein